MTTWTGQAHLLAADIREPGSGAAALNASAWRARVNPEATRGLVGAALALTGGEAGSALWAQADPCPADKALVERAAELEAHVAELLKYARRMAADCRAAHEEAVREHAAASGTSGQAAAERMEAARRVIADCDAALEILGETGTKLDHALKCLQYVPEDLASTYEVPYEHVRNGGQLPYDGGFLTGIVKVEAA